jgi:3'-phosphoadenosine 5'-phosphosulfate (PAPS) 3'-phosphatase
MHYSSILPEVLQIADAASHRIIMEGLRALTRDIPVLSEEGVLSLGVVKAPALKEA